MSKKITALCTMIVALSVCIAASGVNSVGKTDVSTANAQVFYAEKEETVNVNSAGRGIIDDVVEGFTGTPDGLGDSLSGLTDVSLGDSLEGIGSGGLGGIGDAIGSVGDALGGIGQGVGDAFSGVLGGGLGQPSTTAPAQTTSADIGLIIPVPAATQATTQATEKTTEEVADEGETVDFAATSNPYKKPTDTYSAGDKDDGIKWLQWIFIYTGYGLKDNGITGVLDEDTVAVVKKLQHEKGLTVDGNITEDVIKAAEVLYYQGVLGDGASASEVSSETTAGVSVSSESVENEKGSDVPVALLIVVLVIIWLLAIGAIVFIFVFKKKKATALKAAEVESKSEKAENGNISSISDLFEEADKNGE